MTEITWRMSPMPLRMQRGRCRRPWTLSVILDQTQEVQTLLLTPLGDGIGAVLESWQVLLDPHPLPWIASWSPVVLVLMLLVVGALA